MVYNHVEENDRYFRTVSDPQEPDNHVEENDRDSGTASDPQEPENHVEENDHKYQNFYAISSLKSVRENISNAIDIIVHVTTEIEKSSDSPKIYVLIEDIGETQGYHSCMMFWYEENKPEDCQELKPRSIYRIENVTKLHEDEKYHPFQLKLTRKSRILLLPYKELPFLAKPISSVFDGFYDFIDAKGTLLFAFSQKREDWLSSRSAYLCLMFKDYFSEERFEVQSEMPTNFQPTELREEFITGYENRVLKIRSAKVLQRANAISQTVLYKNYNSIFHFNS